MKEFINHLLNKQCIFRIIMLFFSEDKQERIIIYKFRYGLAFFGHDISNMTDQEIKELGINFNAPTRINTN